MTDRKYSLDEIDRMRAAVTLLNEPWRPEITWSFPGSDGPLDRAHDGNLGRWRGKIEDELRTYMLNGTGPEELEAKIRTLIDSVTVGSKWLAPSGGDKIFVVRAIKNGIRGLYVSYGIEGEPYDSCWKLISFAMGYRKIKDAPLPR